MLVKINREVSHRYSVLRAQVDVKIFFASLSLSLTHTHTEDTVQFPRKPLYMYFRATDV